MLPKKNTHFRTCNLCEAMCGLTIEVQDNQVTSIKGDPHDPFSKGHICPKAVALQDIHRDPDRLTRPVQKIDGKWQQISWEAAFELVSSRIRKIQRTYGNDAVALYQGNPTVHNLGNTLFGPPFARALKTKNKFSATSVDQLPHHLVSQNMFGHMMLIPIPDIDHTALFLVIGANPMVSNGSLMTCGGFARRLKNLQERGGKMIVVDPRFSETAAKARQHLFIRPGTDALLLLEMIRTLVIEDDLTPPQPLQSMMSGWNQLRELLGSLPPGFFRPTGLDQETIQTLAREFSAAPSAVCYGRMGASTQQFGSLVQWLGNVLNIVTGNFDRQGGALFALPAVDIVKALGKKGTLRKHNRFKSRVRGLGEFYGELPVSVLTEEIRTPGPGQIKALITSAGNPVLSTPGGNQLAKALPSLEFQVAIDIYINETTRHADVILPPATGLETDHYDLIFSAFAVRDFAKFSERLFAPGEDALQDWQILKELTRRIRPNNSWYHKLLDSWMTPRIMLDLALRLGPYGQLSTWKPGGLTLARVKAKKHGIDLGPLKPSLPQRLYTADKKINIVPTLLVNDLNRLLELPYPEEEGHKLLLIGRRQLRSNNSWMHNIPRLVKGPDRCTLLMHPDDAQHRGLIQGQEVTVTSRMGSVALPLEISDQMMMGVVSIPHGWGHKQVDTLSTAKQHAGVSINDLTDPHHLDELSGNAAFSGVPVEVD